MSDRWSPSAALERVVATLPLRRCLRAGGRCDPVGAVTISDVPRLLIGLTGQCRMGFARQGVAVEETMHAGDALFIDARRWNRPAAGDMSFLVLFFETDHLRLLVWHQDRRRSANRLQIGRALPPAMRHCLDAALLLHDEASLRDLAGVMLRHVLVHLGQGWEEPTAGWTLWRRVNAWFDEHLGEEVDRATVARIFDVHPNHLTRVFAEQGGEGFAACLIRKRLARARHLLRESDLPVAAIGRLCGYPDPAAFSAAMRRHVGASPRALRQA